MLFSTSLRSGGFLELGTGKKINPSIENEATIDKCDVEESQNGASAKPMEEPSSIEEEFAREAAWVLERTRIRREQEDNYKRQASTTTTAPKSVTSGSGTFGLDEGYFADHEEGVVWNENSCPDKVYANANGPPR